jgi:hypothetical protein
VFDHLGARWETIRAQVEQAGSWVGPVHLPHSQAPGTPGELYLSVTYARDDENAANGYTFVLSDFSGEEERIRHAAIRTILGNVPYGLFMCDAQGRVLPGYSDACKRYFVDTERGIEPHGERRDKPETATIQVGFSANDNGLQLRVRDDGQGIATERVVQRAVDLGLMSAEAAAQLTPAKQLDLIFAAGVSTAQEVSETSGRGIGMAAVRDTVAALGGKLSLESERGRGTQFNIEFPQLRMAR